jgi:hypothetical protein
MKWPLSASMRSSAAGRRAASQWAMAIGIVVSSAPWLMTTRAWMADQSIDHGPISNDHSLGHFVEKIWIVHEWRRAKNKMTATIAYGTTPAAIAIEVVL